MQWGGADPGLRNNNPKVSSSAPYCTKHRTSKFCDHPFPSRFLTFSWLTCITLSIIFGNIKPADNPRT
jgi:hypothetical protein